VIALRRVLPHPALSVFLLLMWLLLHNTVTSGHVVLGAVLAVAMPLLTRPFWPETDRLRSWKPFPRYVGTMLLDIVISNLAVARTVLSRELDVRPGYVRVPLELQDGFAITILACTVSLTPGTVSVDVSSDQRSLLVHCLDLEDPDEVVSTIKKRYERLLKEMFPC